MRFTLLRRRLTISAPRMAVRSDVPWPLRWLAIALMLGLCSAVALWAFDFGRQVAGVNAVPADDVAALRQRIAELTQARDAAQAIANSAESVLTAERAAQATLMAHVKKLEGENRGLREDLGFFERLIPVSGNDDVAIRGLHAEVVAQTPTATTLRWQLLMMQTRKNAPMFTGEVQLVVSGSQANGKPWTSSAASESLTLRHYQRLEGTIDIPVGVTHKSMTATVRQGTQVRTMHTAAL